MSQRATMAAIAAATLMLLAGCHDGNTPTLPEFAGRGARSSTDLVCKTAPPDSLIPLPIADPSQRIDLYTPTFSNPTNVVNPLFPIRNLSQAILIGAVDGEPLRIETTLMPNTIQVDMGDHMVETLASSFVAILGRRITEFALDRYAQADDGSVWYFGEDVFDYEDGEVSSTDGTWLACKDGPAAMIMAANPEVGNVWRTENVFPLVFEEITVQNVNLTLPGARGPIAGGIRVVELHMDSELEPKTFAPGYGEHSSGTPPENFEATALAVPADALPGPAPAELRTLLTESRNVFHAARIGDWAGALASVAAMNAAWVSYQAGSPPPLLRPYMTSALDDLTQAVSAHHAVASRQAAFDVMRNTLDFGVQFRPHTEVDLLRLDLWSRQLEIDAQAQDRAGIKSDLIILGFILDRLGRGDSGHQTDASRARRALAGVRVSGARGDLAGVVSRARQIQELFAGREL